MTIVLYTEIKIILMYSNTLNEYISEYIILFLELYLLSTFIKMLIKAIKKR